MENQTGPTKCKTSSSAPQRRKHTNSKLGCSNCKRKKIRCDETLPQCKNCSKGSKKQPCSYLSLTIQEIEKIKLTHSLRDSQNKLLNSDFRLPSTTKETQKNLKSKILQHDLLDALDIKFELRNLPMRLPLIKYSNLEFQNNFITSFGHEYIVKPTMESNILPNGIKHYTSFHPLSKEMFRKVKFDTVSSKSTADLSYQVVIGKSNLMDHVNDLLLFEPKLRPNQRNILIECYLCLGEIVMKIIFQRKAKVYQSLNFALSSKIENFVEVLNKKCIDRYDYCKEELRLRSMTINKQMDLLPTLQFNKEIELLAFSSYLLAFVVLMMGYGAQQFFNSTKGIFQAYDVFYQHMIKNNTPATTSVIFLQNNLHFNLMSINMPSYDPQFLFEIESNLRNLQMIYLNSSYPFLKSDLDICESYLRLQLYYKTLMSFLNETLLPIVYSLRNLNFITTYPPNTIYEIFKQWLSMCPSEAMNYNPSIKNHQFYNESVFLNVLSTTLYMYYFAIAASLDAVFPSCKYIYSMTFMVPTNTFFKNKDIMTVPKSTNNPYLTSLYHFHQVDEFLQRHICYASRLFAFFRRRFVFYHNNIIWMSPYDDESLKRNRFKTRVLTSSVEIPITSFNTTLIRPEHYPTKRKKKINQDENNDINIVDNSYLIFTREDDMMSKQLYARNIETLDLFNESQMIQFDYESSLLLRDYRPPDDTSTVNRKTLEPKDIGDYYNDKVMILNSLST